ncbi:MAG: TonB-dependent receptor [Bacteroidota bacterium]
MKSRLLILFTCLSSCAVLAQSITLKGQVLDDEREPLAFANVLLLQAEDSSLVKGVITELDGTFVIKGIDAGQYHLSFSMIGYATQKQILSLTANQPLWVADLVQLAPDIATLGELEVKAKRPLYEQKIDRLVVNVQQSVTSIGGNALQVLAKSPGVRIDGMNNQIMLDGKQGVMVQINGKRSRIDGDALIQLLQSMPASNIEKIELISTPPASYDAEGVAGIINIVLVKNLEEGTNGNLSLNIGYGERPKFGGSVDLNMRKGKVNIYGSLSTNNNYLQEDVTINKTISDGTSFLETDTYSNRPAFRGFYSGRIGMDYGLSEKTTLGVLLSAFTSVWDLDANTLTTVKRNGELLEESNLRSLEENDWQHWMTNINLRHNFNDKWKLSLDYDYLEYSNKNPADYTDIISDATGEVMRSRDFISRKENPIEFHVLKADVSRTIAEGWNLEYGIKGSFSNFTNDNLVADIIDGQQINIPLYTNLINMQEHIYATYVSTDFKLSEKTSAKAGLRYEYTDIQLDSQQEVLTSREYGRFFPTVFLSHTIDNDNSVQLSYSERIQRPSLNVLAPAFFFFSPNTLTTGNPRVRASFSRQLRASYRHKSLMVTVQYGQEERPMFWGQLEVFPEDNLTVAQPENMADAQMVYLWLSIPVKITDWWESRYEGGVAWQQQRPIFEGQTLRFESYFAGFNSTQTFRLGQDFSLEVDGYLESGMSFGLANLPFRASFNLGMRKKFASGSSLALTLEDAFNLGSFWTQEYNEPVLNLVHRQEYQLEGSIFRLTYSYPFGNNKVKQQENRQSASADERRRVQ